MNYRSYGGGSCLIMSIILGIIVIFLGVVAWQLLIILWPVILVLIIVGIIYRWYMSRKIRKQFDNLEKNQYTQQTHTNIHQDNNGVFDAEYTVVEERSDDDKKE